MTRSLCMFDRSAVFVATSSQQCSRERGNILANLVGMDIVDPSMSKAAILTRSSRVLLISSLLFPYKSKLLR